MITWLLSYPRSGNTWLRVILSRCFGEESYDIYNPPYKVHVLRDLIRARRYEDASQRDFVERARNSDERFLIKTHDLAHVDEADAALIIVRDGRAALSSYARFLRDFQQQDIPLDALVEGKHWPGSWSDIVDQSLTFAFARRLVLRYESLDQLEWLAAIEQFIDRPRLRDLDVNFSDLRAIHQKFFSVGRNEPGIAEVEQCCSDLFWRLHGESMKDLGYAPMLEIAGRTYP